MKAQKVIDLLNQNKIEELRQLAIKELANETAKSKGTLSRKKIIDNVIKTNNYNCRYEYNGYQLCDDQKTYGFTDGRVLYLCEDTLEQEKSTKEININRVIPSLNDNTNKITLDKNAIDMYIKTNSLKRGKRNESKRRYFVNKNYCFDVFYLIDCIAFSGSCDIYLHKESLHMAAIFLTNDVISCVLMPMQKD